jgi:hypothetical protein
MEISIRCPEFWSCSDAKAAGWLAGYSSLVRHFCLVLQCLVFVICVLGDSVVSWGCVSPAAMSSENGGDASEYSARYKARSLPCLPSMKKHVSGRQGITGTSTTYLGTWCSQYCHVDILFTYLNLTE